MVRRQSVGHDTALELFRRYPGAWEIAFQVEGPGYDLIGVVTAAGPGGDRAPV